MYNLYQLFIYCMAASASKMQNLMESSDHKT